MNNLENSKMEIVLNTGENNETGITISDVFNVLKSRRNQLISWVLVAMIVGGILGLSFSFVKIEKPSVKSVISFNFKGIEDGLDPYGNVFDINKLRSPAVLEPAISECGLDVTTEQIRQNIEINGIVPKDVIERIGIVNQISEKNPTYLEKMSEINYFPTQFTVALKQGDTKLSSNQMKSLLDAVLSSYRVYFFDAYANSTVLGTVVGSFDYTNYDYSEAVDIIETQVTSVKKFLNTKILEAPEFRSAGTQFSFADLQTNVDIIANVDLPRVSGIIFSNNVTTDKARLISYYNYQLMQTQNQLLGATQSYESVSKSIAEYKKDSVLIMGNAEQGQMEMTQTSEQYDKLVAQSVSIAIEQSKLKARIDLLEKKLALFTSDDSGAVAGQEAQDMVKTEMSYISEKLQYWVGLINQTTEEYYQSVAFKDAYTILVPSQANSQGSFIVNMVKYVVIFVAASVFLSGFVYFVKCVFAAIERKERKNAKVKSETEKA